MGLYPIPLQEWVQNLQVESQVADVASDAFAQLWLVHQLQPYLSWLNLATVVRASMTSRLDNTLYVGLPWRWFGVRAEWGSGVAKASATQGQRQFCAPYNEIKFN